MNRLSNYFAAMKLAKLHLNQADDDAKRGDVARAIKNVTAAMREMMTASNNIASIAFNHRPKK